MQKPIIGIIGKQILHHTKPHSISSMTRNEVKQAIIDHGGTPIGILSPIPETFEQADPNYSFTKTEAQLAQETLCLCHGLIFQGGSFISNHEIAIARIAHQLNIPTLGICSGQTVMAYAADNVTVTKSDPKLHNLPETDYAHSVIPIPNTLFYRLVHTTPSGPFPYPMVNSRHKYTIASTTHLIISATDQDNNCEVIEDPNRSFYLGLRFHPESLYQSHALSSHIFTAFIAAAKEYQTNTVNQH